MAARQSRARALGHHHKVGLVQVFYIEDSRGPHASIARGSSDHRPPHSQAWDRGTPAARRRCRLRAAHPRGAAHFRPQSERRRQHLLSLSMTGGVSLIWREQHQEFREGSEFEPTLLRGLDPQAEDLERAPNRGVHGQACLVVEKRAADISGPLGRGSGGPRRRSRSARDARCTSFASSWSRSQPNSPKVRVTPTASGNAAGRAPSSLERAHLLGYAPNIAATSALPSASENETARRPRASCGSRGDRDPTRAGRYPTCRDHPNPKRSPLRRRRSKS